MNDNAQLEDMVRYLKLEVLDYLQDGVKEVKPAGDFDFTFGDEENPEEITVKVYSVSLKSGREVFAANGGWPMSINDVYGQDLPNAETVSKVHMYSIAKNFKVFDTLKELEEYAEWLELPEQFRRTK